MPIPGRGPARLSRCGLRVRRAHVWSQSSLRPRRRSPGGSRSQYQWETQLYKGRRLRWEVLSKHLYTHAPCKEHGFKCHTPGCAISHTWNESWGRPDSTPKHHQRCNTERPPPGGGLLWCGQETHKDVLGKVTEANLHPRPTEATALHKKHCHLTDDKLEPPKGQVCTFSAGLAGESRESDSG